MSEIIFLMIIALLWMVFASIQDLRTREVADWISLSLIIFALGFRFFHSIFAANNLSFFYQGIIGLVIFFVLGNLFYYGRVFAGGDTKLMIALGAILPFKTDFYSNINIFILFLLIFLITGAIYGLSWSAYLTIKNRKKFKQDFKKRINKNKKPILIITILISLSLLAGILNISFFLLGIFLLLFLTLYLYSKSVDKICMIKSINTEQLTEGDWLYRDTKTGKTIIKSNWEGLSQKEIKKLQKYHKKVKIRQGIPFIPVFLISFIILITMEFSLEAISFSHLIP